MKQFVAALLAAIGVLFIVVIAILAMPGLSRAQAASAPAIEPCLPNNAVIKGTGTDYGTFETADVKGRIGWCPNADGSWRIVVFQWNLRRLAMPAGFDLGAAIDRVRAASSPIAQVTLEFAAYAKPLETDNDKWAFRDWRHQACQWLTATQPGVAPRGAMPIKLPDSVKNPDGTPWLAPMTICDPWAPGDKPVAAPPTVQYVVTAGSRAYPVTQLPDGKLKRSITAVPQFPTAGAPCDCTGTNQILEFGARWCVTSIIGVQQTVVAGCSIKR
jgi:hypothetical protein